MLSADTKTILMNLVRSGQPSATIPGSIPAEIKHPLFCVCVETGPAACLRGFSFEEVPPLGPDPAPPQFTIETQRWNVIEKSPLNKMPPDLFYIPDFFSTTPTDLTAGSFEKVIVTELMNFTNRELCTLFPFLEVRDGDLHYRQGPWLGPKDSTRLDLSVPFPTNVVVRPTLLKSRTKGNKAVIIWSSGGNYLHYGVHVAELEPKVLSLLSNPRTYVDGWLSYDNQVFPITAEQIKEGTFPIDSPAPLKSFNPKVSKLHIEAEDAYNQLLEELEYVD